MNTTQYNDIFQRAIDKWGTEHSSRVALEEMAEFMAAWFRAQRVTASMANPRSSHELKEELIYELADVIITVAQLRLILGNVKVDHAVEEKVKRLISVMDRLPE